MGSAITTSSTIRSRKNSEKLSQPVTICMAILTEILAAHPLVVSKADQVIPQIRPVGDGMGKFFCARVRAHDQHLAEVTAMDTNEGEKLAHQYAAEN